MKIEREKREVNREIERRLEIESKTQIERKG